MAQQQPGFEWEEYVADVLRLPGHQLEGWPELVRRMYEKLQELDLRAILSASRRRWSERFGILPKKAMETLSSTPSRNNGGSSVLAASRSPERGLQHHQLMDIDGPDVPVGVIRSDNVAPRNDTVAEQRAVDNSDVAHVTGDDGNDDDMETAPPENGNGDVDEEDTLLPLPGDDDDDPDLSLPGRSGGGGGKDGADGEDEPPDDDGSSSIETSMPDNVFL